MRFVLGIFGCVLAGCVAPVRPSPVPPVAQSAPQLEPLAQSMPRGTVLRIGIEHLPPDERLQGPGEPRVETPKAPKALPQFAVDSAPRRREDVDAIRTHVLTSIDLDAIRDPIEREALHFLIDLVRNDQRRVRRTGGNPLLDFYLPDQQRSTLLVGEDLLLADQEEWLQTHGLQLLKQPFRQLLRRLPIARDLEMDFAEFRADYLPLSEPRAAGTGGNPTRVSVRMHLGDLSDPIEVMLSQSGFRIGSSQQIGKIGYQIALTEALGAELRARTDYDTGDVTVRFDLHYQPPGLTSYHLSIGDDMEFLNRSPLYSLLESPIDGAPGIVLYVVHVF